MMFWSYITFTLALAAGLFGFGGEATALAGAAQTLFFVLLGISIALAGLKFARDHDQRG